MSECTMCDECGERMAKLEAVSLAAKKYIDATIHLGGVHPSSIGRHAAAHSKIKAYLVLEEAVHELEEGES